MSISITQNDRMLAYMTKHPLVRSRDLIKINVMATTISRAVTEGDIIRVGRGLYRLPNAGLDTHTTLAEVAKRAPNAVICLVSALAFHGLTDQLPRKVWIGIGANDWKPRLKYPHIRPVRFREPYFSAEVEVHEISAVDVRIYSIAKSIADAFRNPKLVDRFVAIESLKSALEARQVQPTTLAEAAKNYGAWNQMRPYLEAFSFNG